MTLYQNKFFPFYMERRIKEIVSDELHRMQAELRLTSQKSLIAGLQDEILNLRFRIFSEDNPPAVNEIISPFQRMISHPRSTDVITSVAVTSLYVFLKNDLFTTQPDISALVQCLCSCQYQITSEQDCSTLNEQIISIFLLICSDRFSSLLNLESVESIFRYCEQDLRQLTFNCSRSFALTQCLSEISVIITTREDFKSFVSEALLTLYYIADLKSYAGSGWVSRIAAISSFLQIAKRDVTLKYHEIVVYTCIILYQQLTTPDDRSNFVLSLRLFYTVFSRVWKKMPIPFSICFELILDFCNSSTVSPLLKSTAFEILIDFVSLPNFPLEFFNNFSTRPFLPDLFKKFITLIMSIANVPSAVPDVQSVAISLISTIVEQLTPKNKNSSENPPMRISIDPQARELFAEELDKYEKLIDFTTKFNKDKNALIKEYSSEETAKLLFIAPGISKDSLGAFFAKNDEVHKKILQNYINLFDFSNLTIDQSIRLFLSSFRIVGEGQIVDRLLDMFSVAFYDSHKDTFFHDAASVHLFSVAWLMLHTSMHNKNVVKKDTLTDFLSLLKGQNNGEDYDTQFLTDIYNSVKRSKILIEEDTKCNSPAFWELQIQRQTIMKLEILEVEPFSETTIRFFREIWQQAAPIYTTLFDHSNEGVDLVLKTFSRCASISSYYQMHDVLDNLVVNLCRFTHTNTKVGLSEESSKKALHTLSNVLFEHGAQIQESWKYFIEMLLDMFRLDVLPEEMRTQINLCSKNSKILIGPTMMMNLSSWHNMAPRKSTPVLSFFRILSSHDSDNESDNSVSTSNGTGSRRNSTVGPSNDLRLMEQRSLIKDCRIHLIIDQSLYFSSQSLSYFLKSLILIAHSYLQDLNDNKAAAEAVACFHWVTQTATVNEERIQPLWKPVFELFSGALSEVQYERTRIFFMQRILTSMFTLINHTWGHKNFREDIISLLEKVASFDTRCLNALLPELIGGTGSFFSLHVQSFAEFMHYQPILTILNASVTATAAANNSNTNTNSNDNSNGSLNTSNSNNSLRCDDELLPQPVTLLHTLIEKYNECLSRELPTIDHLQDFYIPLLQTIALFCIKDSSEDVFTRFRDFQIILSFQGIEKQTPQMWDSIFEMVLFPSLARLTTEIPIQTKKNQVNAESNLDTQSLNNGNENMRQRAIMMVRVVFKTFLSAYIYLQELPTFSFIWFKMVQFMMNLMKVNDSDLNECIPEMLGNALLVMKESGVFEQGDDRKQMWLNSVQVIEPLAPSFKSLFHQPLQPPVQPQQQQKQDETQMQMSSPLKVNSISAPSSPQNNGPANQKDEKEKGADDQQLEEKTVK